MSTGFPPRSQPYAAASSAPSVVPSSPLRRLRPAGLPTTLRGAAEGSTPPQLPPTRLGATVCGPCSTSVPIPSRSPRACDELADQGVRAGGGVLCRARFAPAGAEPDGYAVLAAPELSRKQWPWSCWASDVLSGFQEMLLGATVYPLSYPVFGRLSLVPLWSVCPVWRLRLLDPATFGYSCLMSPCLVLDFTRCLEVPPSVP